MYVQQTNSLQQKEPEQQTKGFESLKDLVRYMVISCNDRVKQFYVTKLVEPTDLKNDLVNFLEDFADLYLNTGEILRFQKGNEKLEYNKITKTVNEWCDLCDDWLQMQKYDADTPIIDIFRDGTMVYKAYLKCLVVSEMFEV